MKKSLSILVAVLLTLQLINRQGQAQEQFITEISTVYEINSSGETTVIQDINITNAEDNVLATVYSLNIHKIHVYDVSGKDNAGELDVEVKRDEEAQRTVITVQLKDKVLGKGKTNHVVIRYKTKDLAQKVGEIWSITLPKAGDLKDISKYEVEVHVPKSFGPKIYIAPEPRKTLEDKDNLVFKYSKETLKASAVTATFGESQLLNFELGYDLENTFFLPMQKTITMPLDIPGHQQIYISAINPKPAEIHQDDDGNMLLTYWVKPRELVHILVRGSAKIYSRQIEPEKGGMLHEIPTEIRKRYTTEDVFWEVKSNKIQSQATQLFNAQETVAENARKVYEFVSKNLEYDYNAPEQLTIKRHGALTALTQKGPWACMEFADLFIALTRAMGIPAREVDGVAFTNNEIPAPMKVDLSQGDLLHAWAEFYDPYLGWVPVDPTWGNNSGIDYFTKLDTNHLAFVIKGLDSEKPYPAGFYRLNPEQKQINVAYAETTRNFTPKIKVSSAIPWNIFQLIKGRKAIKIELQEGPVLYRINNTNRNLYPTQSTTVYLAKEDKSVSYKDFEGQIHHIALPND